MDLRGLAPEAVRPKLQNSGEFLFKVSPQSDENFYHRATIVHQKGK